MNAFTASRGEVRAVSDEEILDAYSLLGAREGVFCEPASAASVAGLLKYGAEGRVVCVLTGHGLKDPQTAMNRAASRGALRAGHRERRAGGARVKRHRVVRVPASSANLGPGYDVLAAALVAPARARGGGDGRVRRALRRPRACRSTAPTCACGRSSALHPADGLTLPDPLGDPAGGRPRLERRRDRGGAVRRRPHVRAGRAAVRAGGRARGPSGQRGRRAATAGFVICARGRAGALRPAGRPRGRARDPGRRGAHGRGARRAARRRAARRRGAQRRRTPRCSCSAWPGTTSPDRRAAWATACTSRAAARSTRRRWSWWSGPTELGAVGATISGAGPTVLFWCALAADRRARGEAAGRGAGLRRAPRDLRARAAADVTLDAVSDGIDAAGGVVMRDGRVAASSTGRATTTGRCPRASSTRASPGRRRRCARWRRRPGCACRLVRELPSRSYEVNGRPEARALLADGARGGARLRAQRRGGRGALGHSGRGASAAHLRPRPGRAAAL